ncbi:glyoxalase/bleomycin resistance/extradiol dioxygenase family protein [Blastopirellula sp. J2-11]|uniref:VOC family protein n=1 Tax=Blastopirellula sp. J2-11 TaxID=2943192 RepID=UPI0021C60954|nr:glyoxalase/bleomycin resistance/extradiol dioxygenase family protein [Blastopirellula sp. J2-11]UUO07573.1 glyoxalase/bleomycin resistance/extradiol dioxygenase family protein [Blastopirellula sp. J2-11]
MQVSPYLFFRGDCRAAFEFYEKLLGAKIEAILPHAGTPAGEHVPEDWQDKIMHACMTIGDTLLMASDCPPEQFAKPQGFKVSLQIDEPSEAERVFAGLSEGGKIEMPLQETFWALRFGMVTDRFGTPWMINCGKSE